MARLVRDLLVGTVWAGALTAFALDAVVTGVLLGVAGALQLVHLRLVPPGSLLGASGTPRSSPSRRGAPTTTPTTPTTTVFAGRVPLVDRVPRARSASVAG